MRRIWTPILLASSWVLAGILTASIEQRVIHDEHVAVGVEVAGLAFDFTRPSTGAKLLRTSARPLFHGGARGDTVTGGRGSRMEEGLGSLGRRAISILPPRVSPIAPFAEKLPYDATAPPIALPVHRSK